MAPGRCLHSAVALLSRPTGISEAELYPALIMYSGLRTGTSNTLQKLLQELGFRSYKQLQDSNSANLPSNGAQDRFDAPEISLPLHTAQYGPAQRSLQTVPEGVRRQNVRSASCSEIYDILFIHRRSSDP